MLENKHTSYSKCFKGGSGKNPLPEHLKFAKENKKLTYIDYTKFSKKSYEAVPSASFLFVSSPQ